MIDPGRGCEPGTQAALWQMQVDQRRLARARAAHQADALAGADAEVQVLQG